MQEAYEMVDRHSSLVLFAAFSFSLVAVALAGTAAAGPLDDAGAAYQRGDFITVLKLIRPLGEQGNAKAQLHLGDLYFDGQGVQQDFAEAVKWYGKSAAQGDAAAQSNLGAMYEKGQGVPQNYAEAIKWYRTAADQ